ncbi:MAG: trehalose-phosphatase, partial [Pseudomonadota bacterium]
MTNPPILTRDTALFLDFDGTLAPLQDDPEAVGLPEGGAELLEQLSGRLNGAIALVSGRDVRDLSRRVPISLWRAGNHGDMMIAPGSTEPERIEQPPEDLLTSVHKLLERLPDVRLEHKARVLALHTRLHPHLQDHLAEGVAELVSARSDYKMQRGKDIVELKPTGIDKGAAIRKLLSEREFSGRKPLFLGDDVTDEDGFRACLALNGSAIKVGQGETVAPHRLADPDAVWAFL